MFATPVDTLTMTVLPLAALLPLSGLVLITRPACTPELVSLCSTGESPADLIADCACGQVMPSTCGTNVDEPLPPFSKITATMIAASTTSPEMTQGSQRRAPPRWSPSP